MRIIYLILLTSIIFYLISIDSLPIAAETEISGNDAFRLSDSEREALIENANNGDSEACFRLAKYYEFIKKDHDATIQWLEKGAVLGHLTAQYNLAFMLALSSDQKNLEASFYWYTKAAEQGEPKAMMRLAEIYEAGKGRQQDIILAKEWYEKAAYGGEASAILKLVEFYSEGKGAQQDCVKAYAWLLVAEAKIHPASVSGKMISQKKNQFLNQLSVSEVKQAEDEYEILLRQVKEGKWGQTLISD